METTIKKIQSVSGIDNVVYLVSDTQYISSSFLSGSELKYIEKQRKEHKRDLIWFNKVSKWVFIQFINEKEKNKAKKLESLRRSGSKIVELLNQGKEEKITVSDLEGKTEALLALVEGMALSNYQFLKYRKKDRDKSKNSLKSIHLHSVRLEDGDLERIKTVVEANYFARDLVNEPVIYLTATKLSEEIKQKGEKVNLKVDVFNKKKIESLKMGGILAVNQGSVDPPTFTVMEWKPEDAVNSKPIVFAGKGVVYDTGGMNLKIQDYMNDMKMDMAGAAAVAGAMYAAAIARLPVHVIGLIPATDNRTHGNAIVSGDVITISNGNTVEVINTDAEGRLILADALCYAKKYNPALVIDLATLTGSAMRAIGTHGMVGMHVKAERDFKELLKSGLNVHERIAEFPMWEEYDEELKSDIADIKNLGGPNAGAIAAAKFLAFFTAYPFIHLDIAGPAYLDKKDAYRGKGATGIGVRLLFDFMDHLAEKKQAKK